MTLGWFSWLRIQAVQALNSEAAIRILQGAFLRRERAGSTLFTKLHTALGALNEALNVVDVEAFGAGDKANGHGSGE